MFVITHKDDVTRELMKGAIRGVAIGMDGGKLSEVNARTESRR